MTTVSRERGERISGGLREVLMSYFQTRSGHQRDFGTGRSCQDRFETVPGTIYLYFASDRLKITPLRIISLLQYSLASLF